MIVMAAKFIQDLDHNIWQHTLSCYPSVIEEKAAKKSKKGSKEELLRLDKWYHETLPASINKRTPKHITHEEIVQLMEWKLSRGKFRPRLVEYARSNPSSEVKQLSRQAFASVEAVKGEKTSNIRKAVQSLTNLKGIGPATASAILAAGCPEEVAFMSDEPACMILQTSSLKYSLPEYMQYVEGARDLSAKLNDADPSFDWTPHKVECTLWTYNIGNSLGVDMSQPQTSSPADDKEKKSSQGKRKQSAEKDDKASSGTETKKKRKR